jgi:hypothetical protein
MPAWPLYAGISFWGRPVRITVMIRFELSHILPAIALLAIASAPAASADDAIGNLLAGEAAAVEENAALETVDAADLAEISGGDVHVEDSIMSTQELTAVNSGNEIIGNVHAGDVNLSNDALRGFTGVGNFVVNTGAQSNLQGSITINILSVAP